MRFFLLRRKEKCGIKNDIDELMKTLASLETNFYACKTKYDELVVKDRTLEKQFKSSFSEYAAHAVVDQAYRIFRFAHLSEHRSMQSEAFLVSIFVLGVVHDCSHAPGKQLLCWLTWQNVSAQAIPH